MNFCEDETLNNVFISSPLFQSNSFRDYPLFIYFSWFDPDWKKKEEETNFPSSSRKKNYGLGSRGVFFAVGSMKNELVRNIASSWLISHAVAGEFAVAKFFSNEPWRVMRQREGGKGDEK